MTERIFLVDGRMATFTCPECKKTKTSDVSKYSKSNKDVKLKVNCSCGHSFPVLLERRSFYRKKSKDLPGTYNHINPEKQLKKGKIAVIDISRGGLRFKVNAPPSFSVGNKVSLEFRLDDKNNTNIKKDVIIKNISENNVVGSEFYSLDPSDPIDKILGFYLL